MHPQGIFMIFGKNFRFKLWSCWWGSIVYVKKQCRYDPQRKYKEINQHSCYCKVSLWFVLVRLLLVLPLFIHTVHYRRWSFLLKPCILPSYCHLDTSSKDWSFGGEKNRRKQPSPNLYKSKVPSIIMSFTNDAQTIWLLQWFHFTFWILRHNLLFDYSAL